VVRRPWIDSMPELNPEEFASLKEIAKGLLLTVKIPEAHEAKLLKLGFITKRTLEYNLTEAGERRLRQERE
jgi:hypothetical protein